MGGGLLIAGLLIAAVGLIGMLTSGGDADDPESGTTLPTVAVVETSTSTLVPTTAPAPLPTAITVPEVTTTTVDPRPRIELFVVAFATAIEGRDLEFLLGTLHPAAFAVYGEDACRTFINDEILRLEDYRLTGDLTGPSSESIGGVSLESYSGPVAFTFQGQSFDATASFAVEDDGPKWFGECAG